MSFLLPCLSLSFQQHRLLCPEILLQAPVAIALIQRLPCPTQRLPQSSSMWRPVATRVLVCVVKKKLHYIALVVTELMSTTAFSEKEKPYMFPDGNVIAVGVHVSAV